MDGVSNGRRGERAVVGAALITLGLVPGVPLGCTEVDQPAGPVDATSLRGKVMCGYQGWFRCPGDAANLGWAHWSRNAQRLAPGTLTFEMWPDMSDYTDGERFPAPGFTHPDGRQAYLFS